MTAEKTDVLTDLISLGRAVRKIKPLDVDDGKKIAQAACRKSTAAFPTQLCVVVIDHIRFDSLDVITAVAMAAIDLVDGIVRFADAFKLKQYLKVKKHFSTGPSNS
jgi:hypothetical protein